MSRRFGFYFCGIAGLLLVICGLQVPAHLRAVDGRVLQRAGQGTPSLVDEGLARVNRQELGAAQLFLAAARNARITNSYQLSEAVDDLATRKPALRISGAAVPGPLGPLFESVTRAQESGTNQSPFCIEPFTTFIVRSVHRTKTLEWLQTSSNPLVQVLLNSRSLTNTVLFPPSSSTSGQAFDAAVAIAGLLAESDHISVSLSSTMLTSATEARRTGNSESLEEVLMAVMSLGQRFNWGQLAAFVAPIQDVETLRVLSGVVQHGEGVPEVYAAVCMSGNAAGVAKYLTNFSETGLNDLRSSLEYGVGGVDELLRRNQQLCNSRFCERAAGLATSGQVFAFVLDFSPRRPMLALATKWLLYLLGGFCLAAAGHFARRVTQLEKPLEVRGIHLARELLFALGFLLVVLLLSEPFLSQSSQKGEFPFRLRLPVVGNVVPMANPGAHSTIMNQISLLTMLLFFVLQALLYVASLVKLAEIRRQRVVPRMKLKLLENEDHLFDAGLYLGFLGTIVSLILVSLGVFKQPSLMAAYSSTSFGILFVVAFKILNLRPARRQLLLEAEAESSPRFAPAAAAPFTTPV